MKVIRNDDEAEQYEVLDKLWKDCEDLNISVCELEDRLATFKEEYEYEMHSRVRAIVLQLEAILDLANDEYNKKMMKEESLSEIMGANYTETADNYEPSMGYGEGMKPIPRRRSEKIVPSLDLNQVDETSRPSLLPQRERKARNDNLSSADFIYLFIVIGFVGMVIFYFHAPSSSTTRLI